MSLITNIVIGFYNTNRKELLKYIKEYLSKKDMIDRYKDFNKKNGIRELWTGSKGPTYTVIAGGLNYFDPDDVVEMCEYIFVKYGVWCDGVIGYDYWEGSVESISVNVYNEYDVKRRWSNNKLLDEGLK